MVQERFIFSPKIYKINMRSTTVPDASRTQHFDHFPGCTIIYSGYPISYNILRACTYMQKIWPNINNKRRAAAVVVVILAGALILLPSFRMVLRGPYFYQTV